MDNLIQSEGPDFPDEWEMEECPSEEVAESADDSSCEPGGEVEDWEPIKWLVKRTHTAILGCYGLTLIALCALVMLGADWKPILAVGLVSALLIVRVVGATLHLIAAASSSSSR